MNAENKELASQIEIYQTLWKMLDKITQQFGNDFLSCDSVDIQLDRYLPLDTDKGIIIEAFNRTVLNPNYTTLDVIELINQKIRTLSEIPYGSFDSIAELAAAGQKVEAEKDISLGNDLFYDMDQLVNNKSAIYKVEPMNFYNAYEIVEKHVERLMNQAS